MVVVTIRVVLAFGSGVVVFIVVAGFDAVAVEKGGGLVVGVGVVGGAVVVVVGGGVVVVVGVVVDVVMKGVVCVVVFGVIGGGVGVVEV